MDKGDLLFNFQSLDQIVFCNNDYLIQFWPGCVRGVVGEGMPGYRRPYDKGNLYIKFEIEFPPNNFIPCDKISVSISSVDYLFGLTADRLSDNIVSELTTK